MRGLDFTVAVVCEETRIEDPKLIQKIEDGKFQFVFAMPEDLMDPTKAFQTSILRHPSCAFREKLRAVAVDECHLCWEWGEAGFRKDYAHQPNGFWAK